MKGFIAVTDPDWYNRLARDPGPRDANFWRPSVRRVLLPSATPFVFKLKAPFHAVAGFGYFASFTILPDWLAWDTFTEANGVGGLDELRTKLRTIQKGARIEADSQGRIGCCLIAEARFFRRDEWVAAPRDWKPRTQQGESYDFSAGEGQRVWQECLERASTYRVPAPLVLTAADAGDNGPRFGAPSTYLPRLGQGIFRVHVLDAYSRAYAVTNEHSLPVLEAAHIRPYASGGEHRVANGLTLRSDLHRLFDRGYITVDQNERLVVGQRLKRDFDNGKSYYRLQGQRLELPAVETQRPSAQALAWHRENIFLG